MLRDVGDDSVPDAMSGYATLELYVGDCFSDGDLIHFVNPEVLYTSQTCTVADGYVSFEVNKGGTYYLKASSDMVSFKYTSGTGSAADPYVVADNFSFSWKLYDQLMGYSVCNISLPGSRPKRAALPASARTAQAIRPRSVLPARTAAGKRSGTLDDRRQQSGCAHHLSG
jgi:hypothetical protein